MLEARRGAAIAVAVVVIAAAARGAAEFPKIHDSRARAQRANPTAFQFEDSEKTAGSPPPATAELAAKVKAPDGFAVQVFAHEPDVRQPVNISFDERGRLWVVENYTYAEAPLHFDTKLRDRIVIFEDRNGDGRFDAGAGDVRKVFWADGQRATSAAVGFGGVWVTAAPYLLFIPDRNRDDVPDGPPEVVLDGFESDRVHHNLVNGLKWGPDGWLYGRHGIQATSVVGKPGTPKDERVPVNCSVWRFHPVRRVFEVVTRGTTNPWGFDYDDHGQMFIINTVIGHLWHVVPGAHYKRMYGEDFDPHTYRLMDQTADHVHWASGEHWSEAKKAEKGGMSDATSRAGGGHAHSGLMIYLGDNWPDRYRGGVFTLNFHGRRINNDVLRRQGAGYVATHGPDLLVMPDPWFRGVELVYGPDGGVVVADWSDIGECHEASGVHRSSGRLYKITYGQVKPPAARDLASLTDAELVELQLHKNEHFVRQARRILQERAAAGRDLAGAHRELRALFDKNPDVTRKLRALWTLYVTGGAPARWLETLVGHADEHVRTWAIRLLADGGALGDDAEKVLVRAAGRERSGLVQLFLASALERLPPERRGALGRILAARAEHEDDAKLSLMIWYGLAPWVAARPEEAVGVAGASRHALVRQHIARRVTEDLETRPRAVDALLATAARGADARAQSDILRGMSEALAGWRKAPKPATWARVAARLGRSPNADVRRLVADLGVVFGDGRATAQLSDVAFAADRDPEARRSALRALVETRAPDLGPRLLKLLGDRVMNAAALRGLAAYDLPETPQRIVETFRGFDGEAQSAAIATLVSRPAYARALLDAIGARKIPREALTAYHARQIQSLGDKQLDARLAAVWGQVRTTSDEKKKLIAELKGALTPERIAASDPTRGRTMFQQICAPCHKLYGEGASLGPDLTGSDRHNLDYLLGNIVDPSAVVAADFRMSIVHLKDGRIVNGFVGGDTGRTLTIRGIGEPITVPRAEVVKIEPSDASIMPEGLIEPFPREQIRDLFAYLTSREPPPARASP